MKTNKYALLVVLFAVSVLASGCGIDSSGIPNPCWLSGLCSNSFSQANGWNNCPGGWEAVFEAGVTPYGYSGFASYDATLPGGDAILGPDGQPEMVVPSLSNPSNLNPIAYCIAPGFQPPWPYIPATGSCQPGSAPVLQGTLNVACPDWKTGHDCVCIPAGFTHAPPPTNVPTETPISFMPNYTEI